MAGICDGGLSVKSDNGITHADAVEALSNKFGKGGVFFDDASPVAGKKRVDRQKFLSIVTNLEGVVSKLESEIGRIKKSCGDSETETWTTIGKMEAMVVELRKTVSSLRAL